MDENKNLNENGNPEGTPENSQPKEGLLDKLKRKHREFIVWCETTKSGRVLVKVKRGVKTGLAAYGTYKLIEEIRKPKEVVLLTEGEIVPEEEPAEEDLPAETGDEEIAEEQE